MRFARSVLAAALVAACALSAPAVAEAQQPAPPTQQEPIEVTDELLERFAGVYPAVVNVAQETQTQLSAAETAEEAQAIQADAQTRIAEILDQGEVTPREYETVVMRLNDDPAMMARFEEIIAEDREGGPGTP